MLKRFLTESKNIERDGAVWNMIASMFMAFQSVILLIVLSHTVGLIPAGIYTMGNTDANLFLTLGKYGTRGFQVSDVKKEYSFREFRYARIISCIAMLTLSTAYVLFVANRNGYSSEKTCVILCMCLFKLPDAFEDVYYGEYQKNERLDVASKAFGLRMILSVVLWSIMLVITKNLLLSVVVTTVATIAFMIMLIVITREYATKNTTLDKKKVLKLLAVTAPLAAVSFLAIYLSAAPRNAIDRFLDDKTQAVYGFISMPVFVVQLLMMFVFNPMLYKISCLWNEKNISGFLKESVKQFCYVVIISAVCLGGAYLLGVPVLSVLYHTDLSPYKSELMIMMVGSAFLGLADLILNLLIVMRYQNAALVGYGIVAVLAFVFSSKAVSQNGMMGAVTLYMYLLITLAAIFAVQYIYGVLKKH